MSTTLITGASGFIGHHLVAALRTQGKRVTCLVRTTSNAERLNELGCELVFGDVTHADSLASAIRASRPKCIYHLAGLTKARRKQQLFEVNEQGCRNLLTAAATLSSPPTVVFVSTLAVAGPVANGHAKRETDAPAPVSLYGKSKLAGEKITAEFSKQFPISVVRPPIVMGPHDRDCLEIFQSISNIGVHPIPSRTNISVSWIHVEDLVRALICVAKKGQRVGDLSVGEGVYFAAEDEVIDYGELGQMMARALGKKSVRTIRVPAVAIWTLAAINESISLVNGRPHIMNFDKAREATAGSWICTGNKLAAETGFRCNLSLREALDSSVRWYRQVGWLR